MFNLSFFFLNSICSFVGKLTLYIFLVVFFSFPYICAEIITLSWFEHTRMSKRWHEVLQPLLIYLKSTIRNSLFSGHNQCSFLHPIPSVLTIINDRVRIIIRFQDMVSWCCIVRWWYICIQLDYACTSCGWAVDKTFGFKVAEEIEPKPGAVENCDVTVWLFNVVGYCALSFNTSEVWFLNVPLSSVLSLIKSSHHWNRCIWTTFT